MLDDAAAPHELRIVASSEDDMRVVKVVGELDASSAEHLRRALDEGFTEGHSSVVLDLGDVTFIDSSGLSVLIHAWKQANQGDGVLTLRSPSATVIRLLDIAGQTERFLSPGA